MVNAKYMKLFNILKKGRRHKKELAIDEVNFIKRGHKHELSGETGKQASTLRTALGVTTL